MHVPYYKPIITNLQFRKGAMNRTKGYSYDSSKSKSSKAATQVTFLLVASKKFAVAIPYSTVNQNIKNILRRNMCEWNREMKLWTSTIDNYKSCLAQIRGAFNEESSKQSVRVNRIPQFVFKAEEDMHECLQVKNHMYSAVKVINYTTIETSIDPRVLPFYHKLYGFQKESLQFGIRKHGRMLLADEMGVGKTIQSLAIMSIYRHEWPFLVICPSSLRLNWQQEILNWLGEYIRKSEIQVYNKGGAAIRQNVKAIIISYDLAWRIRDMLQDIKVVVADEAHYLKNTGNKRSDILTPFLSSRKRVILLTGTPALAKPREIFNLISIVRPDVYVDFKQFGYRYCEPTINAWTKKVEFNGCQNSKELHFLLSNRVMMRRLKKDVLTELPDKQRQKIGVQTDKNVVKQIRELLSRQGGLQGNQLQSMVLDMLCNFKAEQSSSHQDARSAITKAYSLTGLAKLQSSKEYVLQLLENNIKLIIFAHHKNVLDGLEDCLREKKYKYIRIDGTVSNEKRHECVQAFQQNQQVMVALLSITAAGVGLTLTAASTVVFAELHWTPGMMVQAEDRAHRIGQKSSVNCHYLIGENTLDDVLYRFLQKKINNVSSFVDGKAEKLEMEEVSKGEKGKVSMSEHSHSNSHPKQANILFKFQSIKPVISKYFLKNSQETEISDSHTDANDSDSRETSKVKVKREPYELKEGSIQEVQSDKKTPCRSESWELQGSESRSSEICHFIVENAQEILEYSQRVENEEGSEEGSEEEDTV